MVPTILFLSNGHGEDTVGACIARELLEQLCRPGISSARLLAMPIVGTGKPYSDAGVPVVGPRAEMPTGGLTYLSGANLRTDVKAGLFSLIKEQLSFLRAIRGEVDLIVGVGDKVILAVDSVLVRKPMIFVGVAQSYYYTMGRRIYSAPQRWAMRQTCQRVYTRDAKTAAALRERFGIKQAVFAGNPMMDTFRRSGEGFDLAPDAFPIGVLPGSRAEVYENFAHILRVVSVLARIQTKRLTLLVAAAPSVDHAELIRQAESAPGIQTIVTGRFGDAIDSARMIIGLTGTGNEQAAGLGKPVVTFARGGSQVITPRFVAGQKQLLGDSLCEVAEDPEAAARDIAALMEDPERMAQMGAAGMERMGGSGAVSAIASDVVEYLINRETTAQLSQALC